MIIDIFDQSPNLFISNPPLSKLHPSKSNYRQLNICIQVFDCAILFKIGIFDLPFSQLQALKNN